MASDSRPSRGLVLEEEVYLDLYLLLTFVFPKKFSIYLKIPRQAGFAGKNREPQPFWDRFSTVGYRAISDEKFQSIFLNVNLF